MENLINVQNGTYKRFGKNINIVKSIESNQDQGLGQIRVLEDDKNIVVTHFITDRERFVSQFSHFAKKTAQSIIEMCRVVREAKSNLSNNEFIAFCNDIGHKPEHSTIRKYLAIGSVYERLIQYTNLLPNTWTSIYQITQLPAEVFDALVLTGNSMANMTGAQIKALMGAGSDEKSKVAAGKKTAGAAVVDTSVSDASAVAQSTTGSSEDDGSTFDMTAVSETATASSDASTSDADTVAASAESDDSNSDDSHHAYAKQATSTMLERIADSATNSVDIEADEVCEPYEITIRFEKKPSEEALRSLTECLWSIKKKFRVDINIETNRDLVD